MSEPTSTLDWLRRIFVLVAAMFILQVFTTWEVHGIKKVIEQMEEKMPSMTIPVTVDPPGPDPAITIPVTTTQREFDPEETEDQWIARSKATAANVKAKLEQP